MRIFIRMDIGSMEKTINQLENKIIEKQKENVLLRKNIHDLKAQITKLNRKCSQLMKQHQRFSESPLILQPDPSYYETSLNDQVIRILQQKITIGSQEIFQLQNLNSQYEQTILNLERKLLVKQKQQFVYKQEFRNMQKQISKLKHDKLIEQKNLEEVLSKWQSNNKQKSRIVMENQQLKRTNQIIKNDANKNISQLLQLNQLLSSFLIGIESLNSNAGTLISQAKLQNKNLMDSLEAKTNLLNLYMFNTVDYASDKIHDAHTIRCLRQQIIKKGYLIEEVISKVQYIQKISSCLQKYNMIQEKSQTIIQQNLLLKSKLHELQDNKRTLQESLAYGQSSSDRKIRDLLVENEACHQLLYDIKGSSIYKRDVQEKVDIIMRQLETRTTMRDRDWTDITELVQTNRRLRTLVSNHETI